MNLHKNYSLQNMNTDKMTLDQYYQICEAAVKNNGLELKIK